MMEQIKSIMISAMQINKSGEFIIPKGYELYKVPTAEEVKSQRIAELKAQIDQIQLMPEPTDEELIQMGRMMHPYYQELMRLDMLNEEMKGLG
jgi:vacuolar-type H+-ATPase subunit I/STV1